VLFAALLRVEHKPACSLQGRGAAAVFSYCCLLLLLQDMGFTSAEICSPEVAKCLLGRGKMLKSEPSMDMWALGCVLYQLTTHRCAVYIDRRVAADLAAADELHHVLVGGALAWVASGCTLLCCPNGCVSCQVVYRHSRRTHPDCWMVVC
jgi:hypothetical protein